MGNVAIKKIEKLFENQIKKRKVKVTLTNKTVIYILSHVMNLGNNMVVRLTS